MANFEYEQRGLAKGLNTLAGVDEAGRGPLAGPVAAAAVVFPKNWIEGEMPDVFTELDDSKKLTEKKRERLFELLQSYPEVKKSVVLVCAEMIDKINILQATHLAMNRALEGLVAQGVPVEYVLVDGLPVRSLKFPQTAIVKGDSKSLSIAAASILAKVTRDRLMMEIDSRWPQYGFAHHKGYGTKDHLEALRMYGLCPIHRKSFIHLDEQLSLF